MYVPVQYFFGMDVLNCHQNLYEPLLTHNKKCGMYKIFIQPMSMKAHQVNTVFVE